MTNNQITMTKLENNNQISIIKIKKKNLFLFVFWNLMIDRCLHYLVIVIWCLVIVAMNGSIYE
jgi:hypothetical protein